MMRRNRRASMHPARSVFQNLSYVRFFQSLSRSGPLRIGFGGGSPEVSLRPFFRPLGPERGRCAVRSGETHRRLGPVLLLFRFRSGALRGPVGRNVSSSRSCLAAIPVAKRGTVRSGRAKRTVVSVLSCCYSGCEAGHCAVRSGETYRRLGPVLLLFRFRSGALCGPVGRKR